MSEHPQPDPFGPLPASVDLAELPGWVVHRDENFLAMDKPGWLVCHPSKNGPRSSLVGACRAWLGLERMHLVSRLDRETSGVVVLALNPEAASRAQKAVQQREVRHRYLALLEGELEKGVDIDARLAPDPASQVRARVATVEDGGRSALTRFEPLAVAGGLTLARVIPQTGRKHQIRAHAFHLGHPVAGDKIYGPDETLFLSFIDGGWNPRLEAALPIKRQALHREAVAFKAEGLDLRISAPFPADMAALAKSRMGLDADAISRLVTRMRSPGSSGVA